MMTLGGYIMKHKRILLLLCLAVGLMAFTGCNKTPKEASTTETITTEATTATEDVPVTTEAPASTTSSGADLTPDEKTTEEVFTPSIKKDTKGTGEFQGLADSHTIEVKMSNGEYLSFLVYDEKLFDKFSDMDPGTKITFLYGPLEGQINPQLKKLY